MPLILAIESSSHVGAIALASVGAPLASHVGEVVRNETKLSSWMLPAVQRVLDSAQRRGQAVDAIAFGAGPGSFSGVRTACATAQALAYAWEKPLISVDSLEALAEATLLPQVTIAIDARMQEIYVASFSRNDAGVLQRLTPTRVCSPAAVAALGDSVVVGSGATLLSDAPRVATAEQSALAQAQWALGVARVAARKLALGRLTPTAEAEPLYVRNNVAQTEVERASVRSR